MLEKEVVLLEFGKKLREVRISIKISQEDLALSVGFDRTYVSLLERGKRNPSLFTLYQLADFLGIEVKEFF